MAPAARAALVATLLTLATTAHADRGHRAVSPIDTLDAGAVDGLLFVGSTEHEAVEVSRYGEDTAHHTARLTYGLAVRFWPVAGVSVGLEQRASQLESYDATSGARRLGLDDLRLRGGYLRRASPRVILGGGLAVSVPTGHTLHSDERYDAVLHGVVGLTLSAGWDLFAGPRLGTDTGPADDPYAGAHIGALVGTAYQRRHFFLVLELAKQLHGAGRTRSALAMTIGYEFMPGLAVGLTGGPHSSAASNASAFDSLWTLTYAL